MATKDSANSSREASRNASPVRKDNPPSIPTSFSSQPSAAALQRALSASNVQQLQYQQQQRPEASEGAPRKSREAKSATASGQTTPQWPVSPRLKSPPPSGVNSRRGSSNAVSRKPDPPTAPSISVQSPTPQSGPQTPRDNAVKDSPRNESAPQLQPPSKAPSRGPSGKSTLETVQENSADAVTEPSPAALQASADLKPLTKISEDGKPSNGAEIEKHTQPGESGSESAGNKSDPSTRSRRASVAQATNNAQRPKNGTSKSNFPASAKRHSEGKQGMTVETEVVQSIPQAALTAGERVARNDGGSVRLKPSNETIRPKKERRKTERKPRSVNQGTATSKADLFEARVASAVDEANASDSDETFVYESNPPEQQRRQRHHSRTPSVTSSHSVAEQQRNGGIRNFAESLEDRRVGGKRSMKFSTNPYHDIDSPDSKDGTVRTHTPRHIGRFGRPGNHSASYDQDSPFTQASKSRHHHLSAHTHSRPGSPKSPHSAQYRTSGLFGKKPELSYDFDAEQNADDEQTPLISSMRIPRGSRYIRRRNSNGSQAASYDYGVGRNRGWLPGRLSACLLTTLVVILVVASAMAFAFMSNRPLRNVEIRRIENVLASEQELIFDLLVGAINPNTLSISVNDMDMTVLAKSKHISDSDLLSDSPESEARAILRRKRNRVVETNLNPSQDLSGHWHAPSTNGHDHGTDPDGNKPVDSLSMYLGNIYEFDQPLTFDASPIKQHEHRSRGQLRLMKPGNESEANGSKRWESIIQYPFELIVRGTLKYQLPISARVQKVAVSASVVVHPEDGVDHNGNMRTTPVDHSDHWQWIDWPLLDDEEDQSEEQASLQEDGSS